MANEGKAISPKIKFVTSPGILIGYDILFIMKIPIHKLYPATSKSDIETVGGVNLLNEEVGLALTN
jgi:hypothetical protein